ncbi:MAG: hypothetical protein COU11_02135 [Candidatus Harrisonbacteria bacterium CG10_big_fil_rev_8_21_14_0_10_49_15]|uniref:Uncharacterized protein n=1 Tax=Candidatus Harrisonbacteria bacterium CG10_big_fil_rev_8_21_14_0_10_49_15 TaxID=1974587 RepID=A0A2H0UKS3_9BACT|nr:MAG: hypothetical protein COU11_02135 [Candidatus Harrisonbacteria bacterium CG10_big_fil_rev_8_21_14_0_10_49_15]
MYEFWATTLQFLGEVMIAYTAIMVHFRFWKEHKIDDKVFKVMRSEQTIGVLGILFLLAGYLINVLYVI